jgi:diacylglycerol kinase family enzyme
MSDGLLDVAIFPRMGQLRLIVHLAAIAMGRRPRERAVIYRGREIRIDARERVPVHADNELAGTLPQTFHCRHQALAVFA